MILILHIWFRPKKCTNFFYRPEKSEFQTNDAWISQNLTLARSDFSNSSLVALKLSQGVCSQNCQVPPQHIKHLFNHFLVILRVFFQIKKWGNFGGPWNALDRKIQILSDFRFSDFWSIFRFSYLFSKLLSKINRNG